VAGVTFAIDLHVLSVSAMDIFSNKVAVSIRTQSILWHDRG